MRRGAFRELVAAALAAAFLDGDWSPPEMAERGAVALGRSPRWLAAAARRAHAAFPEAPRDRPGELARAIALDDAFGKALSDRREVVRVRHYFLPEPAMGAARPAWDVPRLDTGGDLATWLGEEGERLSWLADWRGLSRLDRDPRLAHYVHHWVPKRSGGLRLLEAPKPRLKAIQRRVLHEILDHVPPHDAAHGFRIGRNVLTHASAHAGRRAVLRMDLEDFFPSVPATRVYGVFRTIGYPEEVSRLLTGLCTTRAATSDMPSTPPSATAQDVAALYRTRQRYATRHLPQGAPTSPALANLCARGMDVRLQAAAAEVGATYSRYADDLVFSGDATFARTALRFSSLVAAIALDEGLRVQHHKTRVMRSGERQKIAGLVVNERPAVARDAYDRLRAILHNCLQTGPHAQNREGHADFRASLRGAVAWVAQVQPARGATLSAMLDRVEWPPPPGT